MLKISYWNNYNWLKIDKIILLKLNINDVRTGKMGLREVNDFRVGSILIDDAVSFGVTTRQLFIEILKSIDIGVSTLYLKRN